MIDASKLQNIPVPSSEFFFPTCEVVAYLTAAGKKSLKQLVVAISVSSSFYFPPQPHIFILNLQKNTNFSVCKSMSVSLNNQKRRHKVGNMQKLSALIFIAWLF